MYKRIFQGLLAALILLALTGCNPFTTNIYSGIDKYKQPDLNDVDALLDSVDEPQFYENLNEEEKKQVLDTLEKVYNDPQADDDQKQKAALMAVDVHLKTSNTQDTMTNFNSLVGDAVAGNDIPSVEAPEELFRELFGEPPAGVSKAVYKENVKTQLIAFRSVCEPLEVYGGNLEKGVPAPPGSNAGDTATKALMGGMTRSLMYHIGGTLENQYEVLSEYLATPKAEATPITYTIEPDFKTPSDMLVNPVTGNRGLIAVVEDGLGNVDDIFAGKDSDQ